MSEKVQKTQQQQQQQPKATNKNMTDQTLSLTKGSKSPEVYVESKNIALLQQQQMPSAITRERSFIRSSSNQQQNLNKRRSLAFNMQTVSNATTAGGAAGGHLRGKPTMEIYRPPKLHYNIQHSASSSLVFPSPAAPQLPYLTASPAATNALLARRQGGGATGTVLSLGPLSMAATVGHHHHPPSPQQQQQQQQQQATHHAHAMLGASTPRSILVTHPVSFAGTPLMATTGFAPVQPVALMNSGSSGNILHQTSMHTNRVKFAPEPAKQLSTGYHKVINVTPHQYFASANQGKGHQYIAQTAQQASALPTEGGGGGFAGLTGSTPLQRSKSLSSADTLAHGIAGLGLGVGSSELNDIGQFSDEVQRLIELAINDPNQLNSRNLMDLTTQFIQRSVEGRRYALPIARLCLSIIAKEQKETFLEALLNTCRQWYQEREKLLFTYQGMKSPSRAHFTAFMAFLTEMFCQLKRRQLQLRAHCEGAPPPLILLTLLAKCCEDCVRPPVRSLSEIECLFYVLTCIGQDLEVQLPQQLELLLAMIRDAFLNASDAAPSIRRILLQLIEMHACHWQLPGNTVLYYYPSSK